MVSLFWCVVFCVVGIVWRVWWAGLFALDWGGVLLGFYICLGGLHVCEVLLLEQINILKRKKEKKEK